ncbi:ATP-binding protein [Litorimonas sp. RW-G-Af-16]|uniref:sensor histidine kinase n=1 Tax=Litorimonas sp. RW-G-Af-16 TaxID=3241168 RepID=UPI00390CD43A
MLQALQKLLRNTLFRLSLLGALLTVFSVGAALSVVYYSMISTELQRVDSVLEDEIGEFQNIYDAAGLKAIETAVALGNLPAESSLESLDYKRIYNLGGIQAVGTAMTTRGATFEGLYLVQTPRFSQGNLMNSSGEQTEAVEVVLPGNEGVTYQKVSFIYSDTRYDNAEYKERRARGITGQILLDEEPIAGVIVGRDVEAISRTGDKISRTLVPAIGLAALLGLISSWFVSRRFARRVEAFNRLATDVRAGQLDRRAPRNYSEDEMDMLAEHLNAMLDHIDRLMKAMRYAGDSVAHDLRTPLTRLRTRLESAAVELGDKPEAEILLAASEDAAMLLGTFDSVLRIARLEAGERRELLKPLNPKPILDDLAELYEPACEDAGLTFTADISDKTQILADRGLLSQAVSNLLENAIKYTPRGGKIHLECRKGRQGRTVIAVIDDGPGVPSWDRERVKERFVRLDKSRTLPGSGLGLALVDAVADLHRAEFKMDDGFGEDGEAPGLSASLIFPRRRSVVLDDTPNKQAAE